MNGEPLRCAGCARVFEAQDGIPLLLPSSLLGDTEQRQHALYAAVAHEYARAVVAGEIMALAPDAPTPPRRSHRLVESRQERLARWRFDGIIAATALVAGMPLMHNNAADFEAIRSAIERSPLRFPGLGPLELVRCSLVG